MYHKILFLTEKGKGRKHFVLNQNFQGCDTYVIVTASSLFGL